MFLIDYFLHHAEGIAAMLAIFGGVCGFLWALHKLVNLAVDTVSYVGELKTNHIPHLQTAVEAICKHLGISLTKEFVEATPQATQDRSPSTGHQSSST